MPQKKKNTRTAQLHPQPVQSDYDTDTANMTETVPAVPPPPVRTNTELNTDVLRRYVPDIERIIAIAPFAVVYVFSPDTQGWEKSGQEGTLFVCQLSANGWGYHRYSVILLNRKSLDNFVTELVSGENVEITEQYVILQVVCDDGTPIIYGLWIFSDDSAPDTRHLVAAAIQECAVRAEIGMPDALNREPEYDEMHDYNLEGAEEVHPSVYESQTSPDPVGGQVDLLSLFNKSAHPANHYGSWNPAQAQHPGMQPGNFTPTPDTDFFRTVHSPAAGAGQQPSQPPSQQNALLNLFKTASNVGK